ncbi:MAG: carbamoyltransferase HypF [Spirochaetes bacterium]|nr:carbamoyltransferase HypF [Spirochaetota bacterium]
MKKIQSYLIKVTGLVQGVGFRPFIYRLAKELQISGWVENRTDGVTILANTDQEGLDQFQQLILQMHPPASRIDQITAKKTDFFPCHQFIIKKSQAVAGQITAVSPDLAVCSACLEDIKKQKNRINYPFTNCTNCGPRFSIIKNIPYDRKNTSMHDFIMCPQCEAEYTNIENRRFHAQPNACSICGPQYQLVYQNQTITNMDAILSVTTTLLNTSGIMALKGMGGFNLICNAEDQQAVRKLRDLKKRDGKPFAVMFASLAGLKKYAQPADKEIELLTSVARPIVIIKSKTAGLPEEVCNGLHTIGAILPYMPIHYLLFEKSQLEAIVFTSGNFSSEPIIIHNHVAEQQLSQHCSAILEYNRTIINRCDDSVVQVVKNKTQIMRRARGYVPHAIPTALNTEGIFATGGELKTTFCLGKGQDGIFSQHIGDLKNADTFDAYQDAYNRLKMLFQFKPELVVTDLHQDFYAAQWAQQLGLPVIHAQHHHAHIAAAMAEFHLEEKVIGFAFDGIGLGTDHKIWGSEVLICDLLNFNRYSHLDYVLLPGLDQGAKEPWRMALSYLYKIFGKDLVNLDAPLLQQIKAQDQQLLVAILEQKINCIATSSMGRLFDAVAALCNICLIHTFEAEAPIRLENLADPQCYNEYSFHIDQTIKVYPMIEEILRDVQNQTPVAKIAAAFHNTVVRIMITLAKKIKNEYNINKVILSGGVFQNRFLLSRCYDFFLKEKFHLYVANQAPVNDGGLALGQLAIGAKQRSQ